MRRSALTFLLATAALALGCSSDESKTSPTEPSPSDQAPSATLNLRCRDDGLISVQLARILPAGAPDRLLAKGLAKFALVEAALLLHKQQLAQTRALDLIDFLIQNRNKLINPTSALTATRLGNVIDAILCLVGLSPTGVTITTTTTVAVVPANNPSPVILRDLAGDAGAFVPALGAPSRDQNGKLIAGVVITLTNNVGALNTPLDKYGQAIELTASEDVLWQQGGVTVALCVSVDDALAARLRVGHEGGILPKFGAIEILPPGDRTVINNILGGSCPDPSTTGLNESGLVRLRNLATRFFLPDPLSASMVVTTVGVGGLAGKFSKFQVVDPQLNVLVNPPVSTTGVAGQPVAFPPSVLVRTARDLTPISGIRIKFNATSGTGSSIVPADPAFVVTGSNGVATATSWTIVAGENTATATAVSPVPEPENELTFTPTTVTFTAFGDFFSDGFEAAAPAWSTTPLWNRSTLKTESGGSILNTAFQQYVTLGSGDLSNGALPAPFSGNFALWYGSPLSGNYIGDQVPEDGSLSGGTSTAENSGDAESPAFSIPANAPAAVLRFDTWFEIEGVNPDGFDIMSIWVDEAGTETFVGALNPEAVGEGDHDKPFTTQGYDLAPVWQQKAFDLSGFKGKTIRLIFRFETRDVLYNGFRGWLVDNVKVNSVALPSLLRVGQPSAASIEPPRRRTR